MNRSDDDDPRESRTISFFVRVRSGSEISIWHRRRRAGGRKGIRRACAPGRYVWREDNVRAAAAAAAAGVNTPPTETAATTDDDDDALGRRRRRQRSHSDARAPRSLVSSLSRAHARPRDK